MAGGRLLAVLTGSQQAQLSGGQDDPEKVSDIELPIPISDKKAHRKHGPFQLLGGQNRTNFIATSNASGLTFMRSPQVNMVHVLVHVRTGIPSA